MRGRKGREDLDDYDNSFSFTGSLSSFNPGVFHPLSHLRSRSETSFSQSLKSVENSRFEVSRGLVPITRGG